MASAQPLSPTPYGKVNTLLRALLSAVQTVLGDRLVGFYLYGSLSLGDFDPASSDVDFLIVTTDDLSEQILQDLRAMHTRLGASGLPYADRLEGSYIPREALRKYDPHNALHPTIGVDWAFHVAQHGTNWLLERHIVREHGVIVWGPSPKTLIDPISEHELRAAVCEMLLGFWQAQLATPDWLRPRDYQAFAVLTMCRAMYTLSQNTVASKLEAAAWACQTLDPKWRPVIERSLNWRHQHETDDLTETLDFVLFAVAHAVQVCA